MLEGEESATRSCQVLSSINPKNVYGATQYKAALPHACSLSFQQKNGYKQLQVVIYGEERYDKGGFEEQEPKVMCSMTHRSTLYLLCDFTEVRQPL